MPSNRQIDSDVRTRGKPMRVLVLGMCRTGTTSISVALRKLGYTPHQMRDVLLRPKEITLWQEAVDLTLLSKSDGKAQQRPYGKPEFDKLLSDYDAVMDIPGCIFAKELIQAYPDAKVILTKRNYSDWETSMQESIWCLDTWNLFVLCRVLNLTQLAPLMRLIHSIFKAHNNNEYGGEGAMKSYGKHNDMVRELVPKERLFEIDADEVMEWQPLCKFLGNEVPRDPFPQLNEEKAMRKYLENAWWGLVQYIVLMIVLPGTVTIGGFFAYTYADEIRGFRDEQILGPLKAYLDA